jgi:hypothetical protein
MSAYAPVLDPNSQKRFLQALFQQASGGQQAPEDVSALPPIPVPDSPDGSPGDMRDFAPDAAASSPLGPESLGVPQNLKPFVLTPGPRAQQLEDQANAIPATGVTPPQNWKQALAKVLTTALPVAIAGRVRGLPAAAGAAQGIHQAQATAAQQELARRAELLKEAEQQRERDFEAQKQDFAQQEKEREFQLQLPLRTAETDYYKAHAQAITNAKNQAPATQTIVQADGKPHVMAYNPKSQRYDVDQGVAYEKDQKPDNAEQQFTDEYQRTHKGATIAEAQRAYAINHQPPQREPQQLAISPDGTVMELRPGVKVPQGTMTPSAELGKPNADEQRRADLATNMNENLDQLEEIVKRRPDLFGPVAGRATQLKQFIGTSDPDVARLKAVREYLGMASVGAHAMRNAQHVGTAADAVMAGMLNSPEATLASIQAARNSTKTFAQDLARSRGVGAPAGNRPFTPAPKGGKSSAADPLGIR